ncbi:MAG: bifunctional folylpolyglutamate synthase/dihydrofolate synthase [Myxococcales bacterium]|nr:MAG: bifunctional folylpolyglutamate synthase/dihydrofolate synthase [Myxococcales bacterium]
MDYPNAVRFLYALQHQGIKLGLERIDALLNLRGEAHRSLRVVHVAGTNGKGSTVAFLESVFRYAGYKTGLCTSPHLHKVTERIRIGGVAISDQEFAERMSDFAESMKDMQPPLSFFETITAIALESFRDAKCEIVFVETGLGGRLDATNVLRPELCVITNVALDHTQILGHTLAEIAREKAGILKQGVPCVLGNLAHEALEVIADVAKQKEVELIRYNEAYKLRCNEQGKRSISFGGEVFNLEKLSLAGEHQYQNAALAYVCSKLLCKKGFVIGQQQIVQGLKQTHWPGRLEHFDQSPEIILDAAHNPDGAQTLANYLKQIPRRTGPTVLLFACMKDKDAESLLSKLDDVIDHHVFSSTGMPRSQSPQNLSALREGEIAEAPEQAFEKAKTIAGEQGRVIVAGSIFLIAQIRSRLLSIPTDPLVAL